MSNPLESINTGMDRNTPDLPQEIITSILKRLPVKSLIRFQCVSKHWKNLIKSPSFIADHLQQQFSHQNPSLLLECNRSNSPSLWHLSMIDCETQVHEVQRAPLIDSLEGISIVGSCNGLLCIETKQQYKSTLSLSLWNPATTTVRHVPRTRTDYDSNYYVTGFGFSPVSNDYKIVRIYSETSDSDRVEVFSLSKGAWKEIDIGNLLKGQRLVSETVIVDGSIFWPGTMTLSATWEGVDNIQEVEEDEDDMEEEEDGNNIEAEEDEDDTDEGEEDDVEVIVSFDIEKEVFTWMLRPDLGNNSSDEKLTVYKNKLAILCYIRDVDGDRFDSIDLWVMEERRWPLRKEWIWSKTYTSSAYSYIYPIMTISRNEIVCKVHSPEDDEENRTNILNLMDVTTDDKTKKLVIPDCGPIHCIYNYVESLVSVGDN